MTSDELRHCLVRLGWSQGDLRRELNVGRRTVQDWAQGYADIPENVAQWLRARSETVLPVGWEARRGVGGDEAER